jgi:hypothetical protein
MRMGLKHTTIKSKAKLVDSKEFHGIIDLPWRFL